jgi:hypothetical protein
LKDDIKTRISYLLEVTVVQPKLTEETTPESEGAIYTHAASKKFSSYFEKKWYQAS